MDSTVASFGTPIATVIGHHSLNKRVCGLIYHIQPYKKPADLYLHRFQKMFEKSFEHSALEYRELS